MTTIPPNPDEALVTISTPAPDTVRIRDRVESSRFEFYFDDDVDITPAPTDSIYFPVDVAARLDGDWSELTIPQNPLLNVRDRESGSVLASSSRKDPTLTFEEGGVNLELSSAPIKLYLSSESGIEIHRQDESVRISKTQPGEIILGARSLHDQPAGTITTTTRVPDVMAAVSNLSSGLKTTNPEHSWPTLRGHPPEIKFGDELSIPDALQKPTTDVVIEVPKTLASVFEVAPLAYYTAAEIRPSESVQEEPAIIIPGDRFPLSKENLNESAFAALRDIFLLDCVVRTEGYYPLHLEERDQIEDLLPWNPAEVYELPIAERIREYLRINEEVLDQIRPTWPLTVDVNPDQASIQTLPYIVEQLPLVRCINDPEADTLDEPEYLTDFIRGDGGTTKSRKTVRGHPDPEVSTYTPKSWPTQLHVSLRDGYPIGSNKTDFQSLQKHANRTKPTDRSIGVHVICNEEDMREEEVVTEFYGVRDLLEFDVDIHYSVSRDEMRALLSENNDLIHYIGHVDEEGILCNDGYLDASEIDDVGIDAFILNACKSVNQGEALLKAGANGGVVTLFDVPNSSATEVGRSLSRLLNRGFDLRSALEIARESSVLGRRWISIGDGRLALTQAETGVPSILNIEYLGDNEFSVEVEGFGTSTHGPGTLRTPNFGFQKNHIHPGAQKEVVEAERLEEVFASEILPVRFQNELVWTDEIKPVDLIEGLPN